MDGTLGDSEAGGDRTADTDTGGEHDNNDGDGGSNAGDATQPDVTVLFRWRTQMARCADAFETEGLSVANASDYLFECPVVTTVFDIAKWLVDPTAPDRLRTLVSDSSVGLATLSDAFEARDWAFDSIHKESNRIDDITDEQRYVLAKLHRLREKRPTLRAQSAASSIGDIIETLGLCANPTDAFPRVAAGQRVANLDALVHLVTEWKRDSLANLADIVDEILFRGLPTIT
ncbi:hypothetical protein [Halobaculum roseum]|uniref:Uncharacterized protein n=1 Tax=Halobaculum roseum TaxID=2175149 RepID=A0ABD5MKH5_9EURY|nr:hypothetical protein [Halobaculum roseum]QZY03238.1 hypothetical protein K6T36_03390 [Halobaculum roseum]